MLSNVSLNAVRTITTNTAVMAALKNVTVIGGGAMGAGIAQVAAQSGYKVTILDQNESLLERSLNTITTSLQRVVKKQYRDKAEEGKVYYDTAVANLGTTTAVGQAVVNADLVIEAITENISVKQELMKTIDKLAPDHALFASNTSSLSIHDIFSVTERMNQCGGLHFFNPVPVMKLVEVVRVPEMSENTFQSLRDFAISVGKVPVACKDTPGFVVNRLLVPYLMESMRLLERGEASAEDIDTAMKLGAGHPMGPLELADYVGLDVTKFIVDGWHQRYPEEPRFKPVAKLDKLCAEGKLGRKTGEGIYKYDK